jgi:hypothetical protein
MLYYLSIYSVFIPLAIGIVRYKAIAANTKILFLILVFASIAHLATILEKDQPIAFYNAYIVIDACLWPIFFILSYKLKMVKKIVSFLLLIHVLFLCIFFLFYNFVARFYYELVCINSVIQVSYIAIYFYEINQRKEYVRLKNEPAFVVSIGLLLYSVCTFLVFLFYYKINEYFTKSELNSLWEIHHIFNALMYFIFSFAFFVQKKNKEYA